jgi:hypothetical protein
MELKDFIKETIVAIAEGARGKKWLFPKWK